MANYANAKATIAANIYTNHRGEVTAESVKTAANEIVDTLIAGGYLYAGIAKLTPTQTNPGSPDANVFYIATEPGTYTNFVGAGGSLVVAEGEVAIFKYNGTWSKEVTGAATAAKVNQLGQKADAVCLMAYHYDDLTERGHYVTDNDILGSFVENVNQRTGIFDIPNGAYLLKYNCGGTNGNTDLGVFFIDSSNKILCRRLQFDADNSLVVPNGATKVLFSIVSGYSNFIASFYTFKQIPSMFFDSRNYYDFARTGYYDTDGVWHESTSRRSIKERIPIGTKEIYYRDIIANNSDHLGIRLYDSNGDVVFSEDTSKTNFRHVNISAFPTAVDYSISIITNNSIIGGEFAQRPFVLFSSVSDLSITEKFAGKTILIFGDSISKTEDPNGLTYPDYIANMCGANVINCAIGGTHLSDMVIDEPGTTAYYNSKISVISMVKAFVSQNFTSVDEAAAALNRDDVNEAIANLKSVNRNNRVDYAIIMAGTNDYNFTPSGERGTIDTGTIYGSIAYIATELVNWVRQILILSNIVTWFDIANDKPYDFSNVKPSSYISNGNEKFSRFAIENRATGFTTFKYGVPDNGIRIYAKTDLDIMFELSSMSFGVFDVSKYENDGNHYLPMAFEYNRTEDGNYIFSKVVTSTRDNNSNPASANPLFKNNTDYLIVAYANNKYYLMSYWNNGRYTGKEVSVANDEISIPSLNLSFKHTWSIELSKSRFSQNDGAELYIAHLFGRMKYELNDVIEQAAKDYNLPFGDMYYSLGWNVYNFKNVCSDGFHPALSDGIKTIATRVLAYMTRLFH